MIKILYTIPNFITAGSGGAMLNIIKRLDRNLFDPAVAILRLGGKLESEIVNLGIPLIEAEFCFPAKPYGSLFKRVKKAAKVFEPYDFDLWHSFHYAEDYTEPLVARFSGAKGWIYTKKNMNWHSRAWQLRSIFAKRIAAQNTDMLDLFFSNPYFRHKTKLIPRGVDLQKFSPQPIAHGYYRQQFGIPADELVISCVAQLVPVKDHPNLIRAAVQLPGAHFLLAGSTTDEAYFDELQRQVEQNGVFDRVHFLGKMSDIPAFLTETNIFVLPTKGSGRMEGCPVALLEAMACGKACVATDIPGSRDIIEDGISGLLVEPENADALAKAINRLTEDKDLREKMGIAARQRVETSFSIEREVAAHEQLYLELMGGKR